MRNDLRRGTAFAFRDDHEALLFRGKRNHDGKQKSRAKKCICSPPFGLGCIIHTAMRLTVLLPFRPAQMFVQEIERADAVDRVRPVEKLDLCPLGDLQIGV
jgi:hypothetical protein